jgi:hypothetical protein
MSIDLAGNAPPPSAPEPAAPQRPGWVGPVLWVLFVLLCAGIAYDLLRGCGVGLPFQGRAGSLFLNYCPISSDEPVGGQLRELQAQNAMLQSRLDRLLGGVTARRQECVLDAQKAQQQQSAQQQPNQQQPVQPKTAPLTIPPVTDNAHKLKFLAGCWGGPSQTDTDNTPIDERYCFDENGTGTITISNNKGMNCTGPLRAELVEPGPKLVINRFQGVKCKDGLDFQPIVITCTSNDQGATECSGKFTGKGDKPFDISLRRMSVPPKP